MTDQIDQCVEPTKSEIPYQCKQFPLWEILAESTAIGNKWRWGGPTINRWYAISHNKPQHNTSSHNITTLFTNPQRHRNENIAINNRQNETKPDDTETRRETEATQTETTNLTEPKSTFLLHRQPVWGNTSAADYRVWCWNWQLFSRPNSWLVFCFIPLE